MRRQVCFAAGGKGDGGADHGHGGEFDRKGETAFKAIDGVLQRFAARSQEHVAETSGSSDQQDADAQAVATGLPVQTQQDADAQATATSMPVQTHKQPPPPAATNNPQVMPDLTDIEEENTRLRRSVALMEENEQLRQRLQQLSARRVA